MLKPLTVWITTNCGKVLKRWEYQTVLPVFWETCIQVKKQQLELCMEQLTGSGLRKEYVRLTERWQQAICCHFVCLIYTQSTSWESPGWMIYKAESRQAGETSIMILRYEDDATLRAESEEELKSLLMRVKEESERAGLRLNIRKLRSWHPAPLLHGK